MIRELQKPPELSLDSYRERDDLDRFCRRFLIPYIDLGMGVHEVADGYSISGQIVLSSPGGSCLWCRGILNGNWLGQEAGQYGKAGSRPQVVWPNGVLASPCGRPFRTAHMSVARVAAAGGVLRI
jgi:hypothetical protein